MHCIQTTNGPGRPGLFYPNKELVADFCKIRHNSARLLMDGKIVTDKLTATVQEV